MYGFHVYIFLYIYIIYAVPAGRTRMEPAAFICELRVRLRIPDAESDTGVPCAIQHSITIPTTLECVWLEANVLSDTMRCGTWFTARRNGPGFALNTRRLACSLPSNPEETGQANRRPMCTCPPLPGLLLP